MRKYVLQEIFGTYDRGVRIIACVSVGL